MAFTSVLFDLSIGVHVGMVLRFELNMNHWEAINQEGYVKSPVGGVDSVASFV